MRKEQNWIVPSEQDTVLTLDLYPSNSSSFILYEDDGSTIKYQDSEYGQTKVKMKKQSEKMEINISKISGDFLGKLKKRIILSKINLVDKSPQKILTNNNLLIKMESAESCCNTLNSWFYDTQLKMVYINNNINTFEETNSEIIFQ